jgi:hypothetical protein
MDHFAEFFEISSDQVNSIFDVLEKNEVDEADSSLAESISARLRSS